jgi:hypothetical protein
VFFETKIARFFADVSTTDDEFDDKYLKQLGAEQRAIVANLRRVGLIVDEIVAVQGKKKMHMKIYYGITASEDKLKDHAERMKLELRLKVCCLREHFTRGGRLNSNFLFWQKKFGHGFLAYSRANEEYFKKREVKYFKPTDRQRIIEHLITAHRRDGGAHLSSFHCSRLLARYLPSLVEAKDR